MNHKIILFAITLTVLSISSLSVSYGASLASPLYQIQNGVDTNNITCNDSLVLALRTNGNIACVYENTANKLGWNIIEQTISQINYEFPYSPEKPETTNDTTSSVPKFWYDETTLSISNFPKIGETAEVTATFTNLSDNDTWDNFEKTIGVSDNFEIIQSDFSIKPLDSGYRISGPLNILKTNQTDSMTITIKAIKEGESRIGASGIDSGADINLMLGESQTILYEDWKQKYPQFALQKLQAEKLADGILSGTINGEIVEFEINEDMNYTLNDDSDGFVFEDQPEAYIREQLEEMGYSPKEIEEIIIEIQEKKSLSDLVGTQEHPSISPNFSLSGIITNPPSDYDPGGSQVYGLDVCAIDRTLGNNAYTYLFNYFSHELACTTTTQGGVYYIRNIVNIDPDGDETGVDLYILYSTNGNYVKVKNENDGFYYGIQGVYHDVPLNVAELNKADYSLSGFSTLPRAAWIVDALHDAREYFDDEDIRIKSVEVKWQSNKKLNDVTNSPCGGACYSPSTSVIWLDGTTPKGDGDEHRIWTQLHEYGHHVMRNELGADNNWGGCNNPHGIDKTNTESCAWSEGWGGFVPSLVLNEQKVQWLSYAWVDLEKGGISSSASPSSGIYIEFPTIDDDGEEVGYLSEGRVSSMLWDLKDTVQDSTFDKRDGVSKDNINVSRNEGDILDSFSDLSGLSKTFQDRYVAQDYYEMWNDNNRDTLDSISYLHYMGFLNSPPVMDLISNKFVDELRLLTFFVTASDPDGDNLTFSLTSGPSGASISTSGIFRWTPTESQVGTHNITVKVTDGELSDTDTFRVTVNNVNNQPVATPHSTITLLQDDTTTFWLYGTDEDGDTLSFSIINTTDDGSLSTVGMGQFDTSKQYRYTPDTGFSGTDSFSFRVNDGTENSNTVTVNITVNPIIPITFTTSWSGDNQITLRFSESLTKQFVTSDFTLSVGTINDVTNFSNSATRHLIVSSVPDNTSVTVTFVGGDYNLGGNSRLDNGESDVTPRSPDTTPPVITAPSNQTFEATSTLTRLTTSDYGIATAIDNVDGSVTVTSNAVSSFQLGNTVITWTATDSSGNTASATNTITLVDTTAPSITAPSDQTFEATAINTPLDSTDYGVATATDDVDDNVIVTNDAKSTFPLGHTEITWFASDHSGNTHFVKQLITIVDTIPPSITAPSNQTFEATAINTPLTTDDFGLATGSDIFEPVVITNDSTGIFQLGDTIITWTATDTNGLINTATQTVTIVDTTAPSVTDPANVTFEATAVDTPLSELDYGAATVTDIFAIVSISSDAPLTFPLGDTEIHWTAVDENGNSFTTATQIITVQDTTAPIITPPTDITVNATGAQTTVNTGEATATDIFEFTITNDAPETYSLGDTIVTYTSTDSNGNTSTATQIILVEGNTPITFTTEWMNNEILDIYFTQGLTQYLERSDFVLSTGEIFGFYTWYNTDARLTFLLLDIPENESLTVTYVGDDLDIGDYTLYSGEYFVTPPFAPMVTPTITPTIIGNLDAPVTLIEYTDYQDPFTLRFYDNTLPLIIEEYIDPGLVKLVVKNYPLSFHPNALTASLAAECANEQGKFREMYDKLFVNQDQWSRSDSVNMWLSQYATEIELNQDKFDLCVFSEKYIEKIEQDIAFGNENGVSGAPEFSIGSDKTDYITLKGAQSFDSFKIVLDDVLSKTIDNP